MSLLFCYKIIYYCCILFYSCQNFSNILFLHCKISKRLIDSLLILVGQRRNDFTTMVGCLWNRRWYFGCPTVVTQKAVISCSNGRGMVKSLSQISVSVYCLLFLFHFCIFFISLDRWRQLHSLDPFPSKTTQARVIPMTNNANRTCLEHDNVVIYLVPNLKIITIVYFVKNGVDD